MQKTGEYKIGSPCSYCASQSNTIADNQPVCSKCKRDNDLNKEASDKSPFKEWLTEIEKTGH